MTKTGFLMILFISSIIGCWGTGYRSNMMADGNTWEISYRDYSSCGGTWHSDTECIDNLEPFILQRATTTCERTPYRIFNCGHRASDNLREVACIVQCKENPTQEIVISKDKAPASLPEGLKSDPDVIKKAKRCQLKGGVWINDFCQIDVEEDETVLK